MRLSSPASHPRSSTMAPAGIAVKTARFETPANASTATGGKVSNTWAG
jgi:hypothetical protein